MSAERALPAATASVSSTASSMRRRAVRIVSRVCRQSWSRATPSDEGCEHRPGGQDERIRLSMPHDLHRGRQTVLRGAARERERGPAEGVEREREGDSALADRQLVDVCRRGDERNGRRDQQVDSPRRLFAALAVLGPEAPGDLHLLVGDLHAARDLAARVLAVLVRSLREEPAVYVRDLAHEEPVLGRIVQRQVDGPTVREERKHRLDARADEGIRVIEPGEADAQLTERLELDGGELRGERAHQVRAARDGRGDRPDVVVARCEREATVLGHEPPGRLEADDAAPGGRDADGPARIGAERELDVAGGDGRGGAAARSAREPARVPRVRNRAEMRVLRRDPVRELVQVRLACDGISRLLEPGDGHGALRGYVLGEERGPVRRDEAGGVEQVLDRDRRPASRFLRAREPDALHGRRLYFVLCFACLVCFVCFLAFCAASIATCSITGAPVVAPVGEAGVSVRTSAAAAERRSDMSIPFGTAKRRSLLPLRSEPTPRTVEPSVACSIPGPLDCTMSRIVGSVADSSRSSGPKTSMLGGTSEVGTGTVEPQTEAAAGGGVAVAGVLVSTVME